MSFKPNQNLENLPIATILHKRIIASQNNRDIPAKPLQAIVR